MTLLTVAATMLIIGCGGKSTKKGASTPSPVGPAPIVAREGEFRTIIPRGYTNFPSKAQYWANGPVEAGVVTSLIVVREVVNRRVSISTYARNLRLAFKRVARRVSRLQPLSVGGKPAFAIDYLVTATGTQQGKETHVRQVLAKHGPWVFFIRDIATPAQYGPSLAAFDEVLSNWRWL